jgi:hypothetical protein
MAKDFLSSQIKSGKIIGSGEGSLPKISIYSDTVSTNSVGGIPDSVLQNVGQDTFLFISGSICGKKNSIPKSVSTFGGDVVISGSLYVERVDDSLWEIDPLDSNNLVPTNILDTQTGLFALDLNTFVDVEGFIINSQYTMTNRHNAVDRHFEFDSDDNVMPIDEDNYNSLCQSS